MPQEGILVYTQCGMLLATCLGTNTGLLSQAWFPRKPRMTSGTTLKGKERNGTRVSRNLLLVFCGVHKAHTCPPPDPGSDTFHFPHCFLKTSHILLVWCLYLEWSFGLVCFSYSYSTFKTHLCKPFSISFPSFHSYFKPLLMESFSCQIIGLL